MGISICSGRGLRRCGSGGLWPRWFKKVWEWAVWVPENCGLYKGENGLSFWQGGIRSDQGNQLISYHIISIFLNIFFN